MTAPTQVLFNSLEQVLSADATRAGALAGKAAMDVALQVSASELLTTPRDVVLRGLDASAGAGLSVNIGVGALARFDAGAGANNSQYQLGSQLAVENVVLGAADGANPRVDLIHGTPTAETADSTIRNILTLPSRVVVPTLVDKTINPGLTLAVTAGTAAATILDAQFPTAPAGSVPLWYVFIPSAAVGLADAELIDARVQFNAAAIMDAHYRKFGFLLSTGAGGLNFVRFGSGEAIVNGAQVKHEANVEFAGADIFELPAGVIAADTEHQVYVVGRGSGDPVGKTVSEPFIPVLDTANAPDETGRPSGALLYRPLRGIHDELRITAANPLYVGTMLSTTAGAFQESGGYPMSKGGTRPMFWARGSGRGTPGLGGGVVCGILTGPPRIAFVGVDDVTVGTAIFLLNSVPVLVNSQTINMPGSLTAPDVEASSAFFFIYARPREAAANLSTSLSQEGVYVLSSEAPDVNGGKPTPEAGLGFTSFEYCFVGTIFNNAASAIEPFQRHGNRVIFLDRQVIDSSFVPANDPGKTPKTLIAPVTSRIGIITYQASSNATGAGTVADTYQVFSETGRTPAHARIFVQFQSGGSGDDGANTIELDIPITAAQVFESNVLLGGGAGSTANVAIDQLGYVEDVEALP